MLKPMILHPTSLNKRQLRVSTSGHKPSSEIEQPLIPHVQYVGCVANQTAILHSQPSIPSPCFWKPKMECMLIFSPLKDADLRRSSPWLMWNLPPVTEDSPAGIDLIHWMLVAIIYIKRSFFWFLAISRTVTFQDFRDIFSACPGPKFSTAIRILLIQRFIL